MVDGIVQLLLTLLCSILNGQIHYMIFLIMQDYLQFSKNVASLFPIEAKAKDVSPMNPVPFSGFSKIKNLYITGHNDGAINFWDASCPILIPIISIKQQVNA